MDFIIKIIVYVIVGLLLIIGMVFMAISTIKRQGNMGINMNSVVCPRCQTPVSSIRIPKSTREIIWGGWTCPNCGCKMDKWGNEII